MLLQDKVVIVTGAANGLGAGIAEALLEGGARVVLADLRLADVENAARRLDPEGTRTLGVEADVTSETAIDAMLRATVERYGRLDGLVNNAGIVNLVGALDEDSATFARQYAVNATGLFSCAKAAAGRFIAQGDGGAIVNIASNAGKVGFPGQNGYNASKAAVINLTRNLAAEWAPHAINVNAVCPGSVATPMLQNVAVYMSSVSGRPAADHFAEMVPVQLGRHVQPIEVGRVVAFLLSPRAEIIRGQSINVDAGATPY